ncbi:MAG: acyl-CoA synthetase [Candidatus Zhuqueibacterota bacterium]
MHNFEIDWVKKWAKYTPNRMALREHQRDLQWSYAELNQRVNALARFLRDHLHIQKGDRIAVYSKNRAEYVFLFWACVKTGAILVPLNFRLTAMELVGLLRNAEPALFIFEQDLDERVQQLQSLWQFPAAMEISSLTSFLTDAISADQPIASEPGSLEDIVMILYTAGTTGVPKGAKINFRMLLWNSINTGLRLDITSSDHTQSFAPFFHTGGWNVLLTPFFHHGASHTLLNSFNADLILELMEKERTTLLFGVPTMLQMMADSPLFRTIDLSSVRYAIVGGAPMPIPLINIWHDKGVRIRQGYGLTEVGPNVFSLHQDDAVRKKGSIGFPNFYMETKVVNDQRQECGDNEVGELWLKSPVVTPGYWRKEDETNEAITDGWFHTGDMVRRDEDGYFFVVDRKKNMFISGGENVYPAEIERVLEAYPGVKEVAVIGVPDEKWGEVGCAFIVAEQKGGFAEKEIWEFCQDKLAKFKIPKYVRFINQLPRNDAGKVDRNDLKKKFTLTK